MNVFVFMQIFYFNSGFFRTVNIAIHCDSETKVKRKLF